MLWLKHNSYVSATARRLTDRVRTTPNHATDEKASISGLAAYRSLTVILWYINNTSSAHDNAGYPLAQHSRGPFSILFLVFLFIRFPLASHLIPYNSHRVTILFYLLVYSIQLSHSCPDSSLTVYLHKTPFLIPSVRTLGPSSVRRSIGILHPVSLPTCPRKRTKILSLVWCSNASSSTHVLIILYVILRILHW